MICLTRKLVRETKTTMSGDPIVIELHATALFVRIKGSRKSYPIPYGELFEIATRRNAKRQIGSGAARSRV
jgi:hypothetical protein